MIRYALKFNKSPRNSSMFQHIELLYYEQLKGLTETTVDCHKSRVIILLAVFLKPTESEIKNNFYHMQQSGITLRIYHHTNVKTIRDMYRELSPIRERLFD